MNQTKPAFLLPEELAMIRSDLVELMADNELNVSTTYRDFQGETFTPSTGAVTPSYTDYSLKAIMIELRAREVRAGNGLYQLGDFRFHYNAQELIVEPAREDRIVYDGHTYELVKWYSDTIKGLWSIVARRQT